MNKEEIFMQLEEIRKNPAKKILQFSVPAIISMVLTALITVADGFFMGNYVGKEGIAAVNLGLPMIYLYLGVGLMISIGGVAVAGMALGSGDTDFANQVFRQTITTTVIVSGLISIILVFCFSPMLSVLRADEITKGYFREYYRIMLLELPVMVVNSSYTGKIRQVAETYIKKIGQAGKEGKIREKAEIITPRFCNSFLFSGLTGLRFLQRRVRFPL